MIKIEMSKGDIYQITITTLMHSVFTFNISKNIEQLIKLVLVCKKI